MLTTIEHAPHLGVSIAQGVISTAIPQGTRPPANASWHTWNGWHAQRELFTRTSERQK